jgi:uncharacterized protein
MQVEHLPLAGTTPGTAVTLRVLRFGPPGVGPSAYIQAGLHADELPPLLVALELQRRLAALEAEGALRGEVRLVPVANPLGLAQMHLGLHQGRFAFGDGVNFNRSYADLAPAATAALQNRLGSDEAANTALARQALRDAAAVLGAAGNPVAPAQDLKRHLLQAAAGCDVVLDLHCDNDAVVHLYALTPQAAQAEVLGALLGAQAVLLATESGDSPFDEACSVPWLKLQQTFAGHPLALGCFAATVELRGQRDAEPALARQDADALIEFLRHAGIVAGPPAVLPPARCRPTPLTASEPVTVPRAGIVVFHAAPGDPVEAGQTVAELVCLDSGETLPMRAQSSGLMYARELLRWAPAGARVAKIAGTTLQRSGKLLSD